MAICRSSRCDKVVPMDWFTQRPESGSAAHSRHRSTVRCTRSPTISWSASIHDCSDLEWLNQEHSVTAILNLQDDEDLRINALDERKCAKLCSRHRDEVGSITHP